MSLFSLPPELLLEISKHLRPYDLSSLILTSKHLHKLLTPDLHSIALRDYAGLSPLCWAAQKGHEPLVKFILDSGADINARKDGLSPLIWASGNAHKDIVRLLLQRGADINSRDSDGLNALMTAVQQPNVAVCRLLLKMGAEPNAVTYTPYGSLSSLSWAVRSATVDEGLIQLLLDSGARVNDRTSRGATVLHSILMWSRNYLNIMEPVRALLQAGVDIDAQETGLNTALHLALPCVAMVKLLVEWGANLEIQNYSGQTPLHQAVYQGEVNAVRVLLENRAKTDVKDHNGGTLLEAATRTIHCGDIVKLLEMHMS